MEAVFRYIVIGEPGTGCTTVAWGLPWGYYDHDALLGSTALIYSISEEVDSKMVPVEILDCRCFPKDKLRSVFENFQNLSEEQLETAFAKESKILLSMQFVWKNFFENIGVVILVFSVTDTYSFFSCLNWKNFLTSVFPNAKFLLVGTKTDIREQCNLIANATASDIIYSFVGSIKELFSLPSQLNQIFMPILEFPEEILLKIFSFLSLGSLLRTMTVNKKFYNLILANLWTLFYKIVSDLGYVTKSHGIAMSHILGAHQYIEGNFKAHSNADLAKENLKNGIRSNVDNTTELDYLWGCAFRMYHPMKAIRLTKYD